MTTAVFDHPIPDLLVSTECQAVSASLPPAEEENEVRARVQALIVLLPGKLLVGISVAETAR